MRRVLSFDVDDVIAKTGYLPIMDRTAESYLNAELYDPVVPEVLNSLIANNEVYFISSRSFRDATELTRQWMYRKGINLVYIGGLICNVVPTKKKDFVTLLHATYHFDDDPSIVASMPGVGRWFHPQGDVRDWLQVYHICSMPSLHVAYCPQQGELFV